MKQQRISITLPKELLEKSDKIAKEKSEGRSKIVRELLFLGLKEYTQDQALKLYIEGRVSLGKAAQLANTSLWNFIDLLKEKKVPIKYDLDDIKKEIERI